MLDPSFEESKIPLRILLIVSENVNLGKPTASSKDFLLESDLVDFLVNELDPENDEQETVVQTILNNLGIDND
ncbi:hypothetical protein TVAG_401760 [Trichomonas vaginalis G3]|uniref:Uncharacterized protein n=1 Tax=Trichomonas vaginalis (strain ATCC PRA-98 / G3) TaxID=412133 RepID=A2EGE2_TRIV3|nr:hypothetical protein TVAGG3_0130730 [Trichomonas vaginalis G3]EAY08321.1 hypothetical protein TVAG_401760 [Trichomonas vaginalis G3]KAI5546078.1 hypothetical protein TVAGG3_0130730 [Trichomonas vaginalis G3]|eukprot:XP_001320544.1 hypothetical protein [Trichomonas vaginalis G3]